MRLWLLYIGLLTSLGGYAQERPTLVLPGKLPNPQLDISYYTTYYEDSRVDASPLSVLRTQQFRPFLQKQNGRLVTPGTTAQWMLFSLQNSHPNDVLKLWLYVGRHYSVRLYSLDSAGQPTLLAKTGLSIPADSLTLSGGPGRMALPIVLQANQQQTYLLSINAIFSSAPLSLTLYTELSYKAFLYNLDRNRLPVLAFYVGLISCLLFMASFALGQYLTNRDLIYVWYSFYLLTICLHFLHIPEAEFQLDWWLPNQPLTRMRLFPFAQVAMVFFYTLFFGTLLELPRYQPRLWGWYKHLLVVLTCLFFGELSGFLIWGPETVFITYFSNLFGGLTILLIVSVLILAGLALRGKHALRGYAFIGLLCVVSGGIIMILLNRFDLPRTSVFLQLPSLFLGIGTLLEVLCFSLALGRRAYLIEVEKKQIQEQHTLDLEIRLAERTREIEAQRSQLEQQHIRQLETEFERKLADTEMVALRAQMNPHFIFNCLNSIKLYTLQNDSEQASEFLSKFARLIRLVLENSRSELVTLRNELEALQLYIELEAMRFKEKLRYQISVSPEVDPQYLRIPPLLLQPFVENAIWHGLMHKPDGGTVTIEIRQPQDNLLHIEITDDGVGRAQATELKSKSAGKHKSFGMQVTADRIRMINQRYQIQTHTSILDLVDSYGDSAGTKVVLEIPV